ncbi:hypothetical protein L596_026369 [Steinernema carpocapsae]|uniref:7TM GPCR serpentine receptor class x (Srx) domain-containing protein n=1 Tax=Steinernema carpocapsae TaxID=34508 RepID=A0A4V5ZY55_STECR|nr:hypothetical protein L596_026369 [Steinernema carpocapsae]
MYTPLSITISCAIGILAFLSMGLNFTVIGVIKHGGFASKQRGNPIYIIALANMLGDVFQLCLILGYIVPSTFVQVSRITRSKSYILEFRTLSTTRTQ